MALPFQSPVRVEGAAADWKLGLEQAKPGCYAAVFFPDDYCWHERLLLSACKDSRWMVRTLDGDEYLENYKFSPDSDIIGFGLMGDQGDFPASVTGDVYRFASYFAGGKHNAALVRGLELANKEPGGAVVFDNVKDCWGAAVSASTVLPLVQTRVSSKKTLKQVVNQAAPSKTDGKMLQPSRRMPRFWMGWMGSRMRHARVTSRAMLLRQGILGILLRTEAVSRLAMLL